MKKNIILESDSFYTDKLSSWFQETGFSETYNIYILTRPERKEKFQHELSAFKSLNFISYRDLFKYQTQIKSDINIYYEFIQYFFSDHLPARFLDREGYFPHYGIGVQNAFAYYTDVAYNLISFLRDHDIHLLYFRNTPHELIEHFLGKCAEFLNIDLLTSEQLIFPWVFSLRKGIGREREWLFKNETFEEESELKRQVTQYVQKLNGKYEDAMPLYEKDRQGVGVFKHYNPFENPVHLIKRPQKFWCMTRNFLFYKKQSKQIDIENTDYFLFFLHYQAERSTLPEGYGFEDQFFAIKILSKMLPKGVRLIVKEHPSMFTRGSEFKVRSLYNYKSILSLGNVDLCKMHMDNFQLMDHALAVSTITGTVALEAYVRKKPVILFGRSVLNLDGAHVFSGIQALKHFVGEVIQDRVKIDNVIDKLCRVCQSGAFSGLDDEYPIIDYYTKRKYKMNAHLKSLTVLLDRMLKSETNNFKF